MTDISTELKLYTVEDIENIFHCKRKKAYQIMNAKNFPSLKIGRSVCVTHDNLVKFIKQNNRGKITL